MGWETAAALYVMGAIMFASLTCEDEAISKHLFSFKWCLWILCWPFVWWAVIVGSAWRHMWTQVTKRR